jgi:hypothetical protein
MALQHDMDALRLVYFHEMMAIPMDQPREDTLPLREAAIQRFVQEKMKIEARYPKKAKSAKI